MGSVARNIESLIKNVKNISHLEFLSLFNTISIPRIDGLISYYNFNESSGNLLLDQVGSNDGTVNGAIQNVSGKIGTAYSFDGVNDYVNTDAITPPIAGDVSQSFWFKTADVTPAISSTLFSMTDADSVRHYTIELQTTGKLRCNTKSSGGSVRTDATTDSTTLFTNDTWHHIVVTWVQSTKTWTIYVDGSSVAISYSRRDSSLSSALDRSAIGCYSYNNGNAEKLFWKDEIDEFGYWERELTSDEAAALYNSGTGIEHPF